MGVSLTLCLNIDDSICDTKLKQIKYEFMWSIMKKSHPEIIRDKQKKHFYDDIIPRQFITHLN